VAALVAGCLLAINPCRRVVYGQRMPAARRLNGRMIRRSRAFRQATHSTEAAFLQEIAVSLQADPRPGKPARQIPQRKMQDFRDEFSGHAITVIDDITHIEFL